MIKIIDFLQMKEIAKAIDSKKLYEWVDVCLRDKNDFQMPTKTRLSQNDGNYFAVMPSLYEKRNIAIVKMIGRHVRKEGEERPIMMSDILMYEADTGILKAVMDGEYITTLRTGAIAAYSAILYGKKEFSVLGLIGLGNIMTACLDILFSKIQDRKLTVKLFSHNGQEERIKERYKDKANIEFICCNTYEETIKGSEVIISALTRATEDFCSDDCYDEGCTVIPIMTLGFQNCDLFFDHIFTDEVAQIRDFKYFDKFKSVNNTTDVLNKNVLGRQNAKERILVYNYGLSTLDLYFAFQFYERSEGYGKETEYHYCNKKYFM